MSKILIVEDDAEIAILEKDYLEINGFETEIIADGNQALAALQKGGYDLVLLDLMLPGSNGYDICRQIRGKIDIPILMVTAQTKSTDKIRGLGLGADDYIAKPFDPAELAARVKSHLNRYERLTNSAKGSKDDTIIIGGLKILPKSWIVYKGETEIKLPNREFGLLLFLAENPNTVFSKEQFLKKYGALTMQATARP